MGNYLLTVIFCNQVQTLGSVFAVRLPGKRVWNLQPRQSFSKDSATVVSLNDLQRRDGLERKLVRDYIYCSYIYVLRKMIFDKGAATIVLHLILERCVRLFYNKYIFSYKLAVLIISHLCLYCDSVIHCTCVNNLIVPLGIFHPRLIHS